VPNIFYAGHHLVLYPQKSEFRVEF